MFFRIKFSLNIASKIRSELRSKLEVNLGNKWSRLRNRNQQKVGVKFKIHG